MYVGYEFKRLARGELDNWSSFLFRVLIATAIAVVQVVWGSLTPTGSEP